eukprot:2894407-Amphidinium_carterae.1
MVIRQVLSDLTQETSQMRQQNLSAIALRLRQRIMTMMPCRACSSFRRNVAGGADESCLYAKEADDEDDDDDDR